MIKTFNMDCMEFMKDIPDKYYDLAIVDPPYGIDADKKNNGANSENHLKKSKAKINSYKTGWDSDIPSEEYFIELFRISKKQIVWGANYFGLMGGYLFWNKNVTMPTYSQGELAWLSWLNKIDYLELTWHGMLQHDMLNKEQRIHPTQKPVQLYKWLLKNYATCPSCENKGWIWLTMGKQTDCPKCKGYKPKIIDTHGGSGSIMIACHDMGFDLDWIELDKDYYEAAIKRFEQHKKQLKLL